MKGKDLWEDFGYLDENFDGVVDINDVIMESDFLDELEKEKDLGDYDYDSDY